MPEYSSPGDDAMSLMWLLDAVQPLCSHHDFVRSVLHALKDIVPNDQLSYNELPYVDEAALPSWDRTELLDASIVVTTPSADVGSLTVDDQIKLSVQHIHEHPGLKRGTRTVYRNSDLVAPATWQRTTLYNELHRPMRIGAQCGVILHGPPAGRMVSMAYCRANATFSERELRTLQHVQRILARPVRDHFRYLELAGECQRWRQMSETSERGFAFINLSGTMEWATQCARSWLTAYRLIPVRRTIPEPLATWLQGPLLGLATVRPPLVVTHPAGERVLTIQHLPGQGDSAGALLSLSEQPVERPSPTHRDTDSDREQRDCRQLADAFGLTARESQVALWMSRGKSNRDIGLILAIRPATVKKHAQRIFDKIGVENRTSAASNIIAALD